MDPRDFPSSLLDEHDQGTPTELTPRQRAPNIEGQVTVHAACVMRTLHNVLGAKAVPEVTRQGVREGIAAFLYAHPMQAASKKQAAMHEAAHLNAYEIEGMVAFDARIKGSRFERDSWGGEARCENPIDKFPYYRPGDLLREARVAFAGPVAEDLLAGGDALSSIGELFEGRILVARAAALLGGDKGQVLRETLMEAAAIVERHAPQIEEVADLLMRRRHIDRFERSTQKILSRVRQAPIAASELSQRSIDLVRLIETSLWRLHAAKRGA
jgi:hypothetical protein